MLFVFFYQEDPPFNDRGPGKLFRVRSNELYTSDNMGDPNYKYRRKHGKLRNGQEQLADLLGLLSSLDQVPTEPIKLQRTVNILKVIVPTIVLYFSQSVTIQDIHANKCKNTFH